jgi:hypothetical protein
MYQRVANQNESLKGQKKKNMKIKIKENIPHLSVYQLSV